MFVAATRADDRRGWAGCSPFITTVVGSERRTTPHGDRRQPAQGRALVSWRSQSRRKRQSRGHVANGLLSSWLRRLRLSRPMASALPRSPSSRPERWKTGGWRRRSGRRRRGSRRRCKKLGTSATRGSRPRTAPTGTTWRPGAAPALEVFLDLLLALPAPFALGNLDILLRTPPLALLVLCLRLGVQWMRAGGLWKFRRFCRIRGRLSFAMFAWEPGCSSTSPSLSVTRCPVFRSPEEYWIIGRRLQEFVAAVTFLGLVRQWIRVRASLWWSPGHFSTCSLYPALTCSVSVSLEEYMKFRIFWEMSSGECFRAAPLSRCGYVFMSPSMRQLLYFTHFLREGALWTPVRRLGCLRSARRCGFSGRRQEHVLYSAMLV